MGQTLETGLIINGLTGDTNVLQVNGNSYINGDVNITGNVNVIGTATTLNTETVQTRDNRILLNYSGTTLSAINGGIEVLSGKTNGENISLTTNVNGDWNSNTGLNITGRTSNSTTNGLSVFNSSGTNILKVRNDGNVGINTSNPNYQLEVLPKDLTGTTQVVIRNTSTSPNWNPVGLYVQDGSGYGVSMSNSSNGVDAVLTINSGAYSYLNHAVNGNTVAELLTAGNSLFWRLPDTFQFRRRATNNGWLNFDSLNQRVSIGNENIGTPTIPARLGLRGDTNTSSSYSLVIQNSGGTNTFVARDDGNVGIGTSTPSYQFTLKSRTNSNSNIPLIITNNSETASFQYYDNGDFRVGSLISGGAAMYYNSSNGSSTLTIDSNLYNGIQFTVSGSNNSYLGSNGLGTMIWRLPTNFEYRRTSDNNTFANIQNGNGDWSFHYPTNVKPSPDAKVTIYGNDNLSTGRGLTVYGLTGATPNLIVRNDGNVGIGTSTPSEKLEVSGKAKTTNFQMTSGATEDYIMTSDSQGNGRWTPSYNLSTKDYGSFYDTTTQTGGTGTIQSFQLNSSGVTKGISITNLTGVTVTHTGVYNIQFSAQIQSTVGTPENVFIWLRKNGLDIPYTNTGIEIGNNNDYYVAAWNFVETLNANDTINLMWYSPSSNITILYNASPTAGPAIPSLILTITQI